MKELMPNQTQVKDMMKKHMSLDADQVVIISKDPTGEVHITASLDSPAAGLYYIWILQKHIDALFAKMHNMNIEAQKQSQVIGKKAKQSS